MHGRETHNPINETDPFYESSKVASEGEPIALASQCPSCGFLVDAPLSELEVSPEMPKAELIAGALSVDGVHASGSSGAKRLNATGLESIAVTQDDKSVTVSVVIDGEPMMTRVRKIDREAAIRRLIAKGFLNLKKDTKADNDDSV